MSVFVSNNCTDGVASMMASSKLMMSRSFICSSLFITLISSLSNLRKNSKRFVFCPALVVAIFSCFEPFCYKILKKKQFLEYFLLFPFTTIISPSILITLKTSVKLNGLFVLSVSFKSTESFSLKLWFGFSFSFLVLNKNFDFSFDSLAILWR